MPWMSTAPRCRGRPTQRQPCPPKGPLALERSLRSRRGLEGWLTDHNVDSKSTLKEEAAGRIETAWRGTSLEHAPSESPRPEVLIVSRGVVQVGEPQRCLRRLPGGGELAHLLVGGMLVDGCDEFHGFFG